MADAPWMCVGTACFEDRLKTLWKPCIGEHVQAALNAGRMEHLWASAARQSDVARRVVWSEQKAGFKQPAELICPVGGRSETEPGRERADLCIRSLGPHEEDAFLIRRRNG